MRSAVDPTGRYRTRFDAAVAGCGQTLVLTAAHVLDAKGPVRIELHRYNLGMERKPATEGVWPRVINGKVAATDTAADLAVVRIERMGALPYVARLSHGDEELDHALDGCRHRMLHLHRFDRDDNRARLDLSAVGDAHRDNRAGHGAGQFGVPAVLFLLADRRFAHLLEHREDAVAGQPDLAVRRGDRVLGAQPVESNYQLVAGQSGLQRTGFAVFDADFGSVRHTGDVNVVSAFPGPQPDADRRSAPDSPPGRQLPQVGTGCRST